MKINYEILWFEDQPSHLKPDLESIKHFLKDAGFRLSMEMRNSVTREDIRRIATKIGRYNKFDLIVFDFDMGEESIDGSEVAAILRSEVFTDMVFYSGKPVGDLRKILYEKKIDGVFLVDRLKLADELQPILEDCIRKICDVNSMRGVVMDEVSRFDRLLREKCKVLLEQGSEEFRSKVRADIHRRVRVRGEQLVKRAAEIDCPIKALNDHRISDFNLVRQRLLALVSDSETSQALLADDSLLATMQGLRNRLAHVEGRHLEDGKMVLTDNEEETFDFERFREIRIALRELSDQLEAL